MICLCCQDHYLHRFECGIKDCAIQSIYYLLIPVIRSILNAYHIFGDVDASIRFVEKIRHTSKTDLPTGRWMPKQIMLIFGKFHPIMNHDGSGSCINYFFHSLINSHHH